MSRRARNLLGIALATLAPIVPAARSQDSGPPSNVESADSVRAWVENHKGFGLPQFAEFTLYGRHVLVVWNSPFSGMPSMVSYTFQEQEPGKGWKLLDFTRFEPPNNLTHVYLDPNAGTLVFVGGLGKQIKSIVVPVVTTAKRQADFAVPHSPTHFAVKAMNELTSKQAYLAMYSFLDAHYKRTKADDVGALLGSMSFLPDGTPADPTIAEDWRAAVQAAVTGAVDANLRLTK